MPKLKKHVKARRLNAQAAILKRWHSPPNRSTDIRMTQPQPGPSSAIDPEYIDNPDHLGPGTSTAANQMDPNNSIRVSDFERSSVILDSLEKSGPEYLLVDVSALKQLVSVLTCPQCFQEGIQLHTTHTVGLNNKISVKCDNCDIIVNTVSSSPKLPQTNVSDVNKRIVHAFLNIGKGHSAMEQFSMVMNMPSLSKQTFNTHSKILCKSIAETGSNFLGLAREKVRKYFQETISSLNEESVIDLAVSFDGTWHKRGHTSNYFVGSVIENITGLIIDYVVLSKFCKDCVTTATSLGNNTPEYFFWYQGHKEFCSKNYSGSSPGMETFGAKILWERSLSHKFRYMTLIGDGDSSVFTTLNDLHVYGENVELNKEECVNHIAKRLGTALRKKVKDCKILGVTLGGKTPGSLKQTTIDKLTKYYRNAIVANKEKDVTSMKSAILATLHHATSTDDKPQHTKCPTGVKSWCFYNRAKALNITPGKHKENVNTPINVLVLGYIAPIYKRLTDPDLLKRCLKGYTQNRNESLHSLIWKNCPKSINTSKKLVEAAVGKAVSVYNFGNTAQITAMKNAQVSPGKNTLIYSRQRDNRRKNKIIRIRSREYQNRKRLLRRKLLKTEEKKVEREGVTYSAGEF